MVALLSGEAKVLYVAVLGALVVAFAGPWFHEQHRNSLLQLNLVPNTHGKQDTQLQAMSVVKARKTVCSRTQGLSACQQPKIASGEYSGFDDPTFGENGGQYFENNVGWTASGVLDNSAYAASTASVFPPSDVSGHVKEIMGDDDIDTVSNGEWAWPIDTRKLKDPKLKVPKEHGCKKCKYTASVKPVTERYLATVRQVKHQKPKVIVKTKPVYITKYKTLYKENTVYVPVYDDPFWNPKDDGRLAGEGVGMPEASPFGAMPYRKGAWYEWGKQRHNMLDALGGTLDTDQDVDHPADLGTWWADSLPHGRFASNLDDGDSF